MPNDIQIRTDQSQDSLIEQNNKGIKEVVDTFIDQLDRMQTTKDKYRSCLYAFFAWCKNTGRKVPELTRKDIIDYKEHFNPGLDRSILTVKLYLSAIRQFYIWAEAEKFYPNIANGIRLRRKRGKQHFVKQHLTREQIVDLLTTYNPNSSNTDEKGPTPERLRDYAIFNLMLRAGLRTIEVSRLCIGDITYKSGKRIVNVWGKGHEEKDDYVPLSEKAYQPIIDYLDTRPGALVSEPLFVCEGFGSKGRPLSPRRIQEICKEALRGIGLDSHAYSAHSFRHTCATQILLNGGTMNDVKYILRHVQPETSYIYVESIEEELNLQRSPERFLDKSF